MPIPSISRFLSSSIRPKMPKFPIEAPPTLSPSSSAHIYWNHLQNHGSNLEKTLNSIQAKLDTSCVAQVLHNCALNQPLLGLRFFIWAGLQPNYRHSSYMYFKACQLFDISRNPRVVTDVIEAYRTEVSFVSVKMFKVVLNLCREANLVDESLWVLRKMKEFNCLPDTTAYNVVIRLFCGKGNMDAAAELMREMDSINLYPDMITYVAMVKGFGNVGRLEDACALFKVMRGHGCLPNTVVFSALLDGVCRFGSLEMAMEMLREMEDGGGVCSPNVVTYTSVIQSFCEKRRTMEALHILDLMEANGCVANRVTVNTLIKGLCTEGHIEEAHKLIDKVIAGGNVSDGECNSSLVVSLLRMNKLDEAEKVFRKMLANAVRPDGLASSTMIKGLCLEGRVLDAFCLYNEIEKLCFSSSIDLDMYSILLSGLCKESYLVEASKIAKLMVERRIPLLAPYVDNAVQHLKNAGS
ncbi:pentatricopeptide repeat-containing protein At5g47360 [Diospyros lotus]|uniref:pentatricopeptide repeat-containing protein At5g47360 n=1 Tax=Diospyros lotus TaxID=55363 RepID=UPI00225B4D4E|nr:pentatricopeptide repeat-containing protein At5g47360 [Diospyros lotus]